MKNEIWIAYVDYEDSGSRENWSVFYTSKFVGFTKESAMKQAEIELNKLATEECEEDGEDPNNPSELNSYKKHFHIHLSGPYTPQ